MYAQQYSPQQTDITPRLIDLVDKLSQRIPSTQLEPNTTSQSPFNTGMFAPQQQSTLQRQEMALRQPQQQLSPQQYQSIARYVDSLSQVAYLGSQYAVLSEHLLKQCGYLEEAALYGGQAIQLLGLSLRETDSLNEVVMVLQAMLQDPYFLLTQAFEVWAARITPSDSGFIELLSEAYLHLIGLFEEKLRSNSGNYSPQYTQYLQSQINQQPLQQQVGVGGNELIGAIKGLSASLSQGIGAAPQQVSVGKQIQRQHAMMRQGGR